MEHHHQQPRRGASSGGHLWAAGLHYHTLSPALSRFLLHEAVARADAATASSNKGSGGSSSGSASDVPMCAVCCGLLLTSKTRVVRGSSLQTSGAQRVERRGRRSGKHVRSVCEGCSSVNVVALDSTVPRSERGTASLSSKPVAAKPAPPSSSSSSSMSMGMSKANSKPPPLLQRSAGSSSAAASPARPPAASAAATTPSATPGSAPTSMSKKQKKKGSLSTSLLKAVQRTTAAHGEQDGAGDLESFLSLLS